MTFFTPLGFSPFQSGPAMRIAAAIVAGGAAADVGEIECVGVDELDAEVALLFDRRHGENERLGAQVHAQRRNKACRSWASGSPCPPACKREACCGSHSTVPCIRGPSYPRSSRIRCGSCPPSGSRRCRPPWRWRGLPAGVTSLALDANNGKAKRCEQSSVVRVLVFMVCGSHLVNSW